MKLFVYVTSYSKKKQQSQPFNISGKTEEGTVSGEIVAAITMAIQQSREEFHDLEETIITMQRITRPYLPWSSKIKGLRRFVR